MLACLEALGNNEWAQENGTKPIHDAHKVVLRTLSVTAQERERASPGTAKTFQPYGYGLYQTIFIFINYD